jgi:uncharacterized YkwD family protein
MDVYGEPTRQKKHHKPNKSVSQTKEEFQIQKSETAVFELVNLERRKHKLPPLKIDTDACKVARKKSRDMKENNYFSHQSSTYGAPWDMLKAFNIPFTMAGENITWGSATAEDVMNQWMHSPGHRNNILNPSFTHIGVGFTKGGTKGIYWTQIFFTK